MARTAKRAAKKTSNSRYKRDPQNIIFYNDKIEQHTDRQTLVYNWSLVTDVHETKKYIYFYVSKQGALIVNKETITKEDYDKLIDLVKNNNKKYYIYSNWINTFDGHFELFVFSLFEKVLKGANNYQKNPPKGAKNYKNILLIGASYFIIIFTKM